MIENNLELLNYRCDGMLSDGDSNFIEKIYDSILERPLKLANYGACVSLGGSHPDCVLKLGKEICKETGDEEICDFVSKAEVVKDTAENLFNNNLLPLEQPNTASNEVPQVDIALRLNSIVDDFKNYDCANMPDEKKVNLVNRLNELEPLFKTQNRQDEFNELIKKLNCDVIEEFKCNNELEKFEVNPTCKPGFIKVWGKPLAIGSAAGVGVGFAFHKIAKGPATMSVLAGIIAGAGTTHYVKKKNEASADA